VLRRSGARGAVRGRRPGERPQTLRRLERIDLVVLPPGGLINPPMEFAVMKPAEWNGEFIAHLAAKRARLCKAQVVCVGGCRPQTRQGFDATNARWSLSRLRCVLPKARSAPLASGTDESSPSEVAEPAGVSSGPGSPGCAVSTTGGKLGSTTEGAGPLFGAWLSPGSWPPEIWSSFAVRPARR
jgi:hypothetical protein